MEKVTELERIAHTLEQHARELLLEAERIRALLGAKKKNEKLVNIKEIKRGRKC